MQTGKPAPKLRDSLRLTDPLWVSVRRGTADGRRCSDYDVCLPDGGALLAARAFVWGRQMVVAAADDGEPVLLIRRRLAFPLTGTVDLMALPDRARIGTYHRSGRYADAERRVTGRFRDARTMKQHTAESLLAGAVDAALGLDGGADTSSPRAFAWLANGRNVGRLERARLPFQTRTTRAGGAARMAARLLPHSVRAAIADAAAPRGWRLQLDVPELRHEPLLVIGAALMTIELSRW